MFLPCSSPIGELTAVNLGIQTSAAPHTRLSERRVKFWQCGEQMACEVSSNLFVDGDGHIARILLENPKTRSVAGL